MAPNRVADFGKVSGPILKSFPETPFPSCYPFVPFLIFLATFPQSLSCLKIPSPPPFSYPLSHWFWVLQSCEKGGFVGPALHSILQPSYLPFAVSSNIPSFPLIANDRLAALTLLTFLMCPNLQLFYFCSFLRLYFAQFPGGSARFILFPLFLFPLILPPRSLFVKLINITLLTWCFARSSAKSQSATPVSFRPL